MASGGQWTFVVLNKALWNGANDDDAGPQEASVGHLVGKRNIVSTQLGLILHLEESVRLNEKPKKAWQLIIKTMIIGKEYWK